MIVAAVEGPGFSLDRLVRTAAERGVRTRMLTRDADVRAGAVRVGGASASASAGVGEELVVTLVDRADIAASQDADTWTRAALTAAIGLALRHGCPEVRALTRDRVALHTCLARRGLVPAREQASDAVAFDVDVLVWGGVVRASYPDTEYPAERMPELTRWLTRVLDCVGMRRGFARVGVRTAGDGFEVVAIEIREGDARLGDDLCEALGLGALTVLADTLLDSGADPDGKTMLYAGDLGGSPGSPGSHGSPGSLGSAATCVAVLVASGAAAGSTLLTAMASGEGRGASPR